MCYDRSADNILYDRDLTEKMIRENYACIYAYCFRHLGHRETAEDITQEVFLRFFSHAERYREYGKLKNYLYVIAGNLIRDYHRKCDRHSLSGVCEEQEHIPMTAEVVRRGDFSFGSEESEQVIERLHVREALAVLDADERDIVILRYYQELRIKDIAMIKRMPASTVRYQLRRAEKRLKKELLAGKER